MAPVTLNRVGLLAITLPTNLEQQCLRLQQELYRRLGDSSFLLLPPLIPLLVSKEPADLEVVRSVTFGDRLTLALRGPQPYREAGAVWLSVEVTPESGLKALFERASSLAVPVEQPPIPQNGAIYLGGNEGDGKLSTDDLPSIDGSSSNLTVVAYDLLFEETEGWWRHCNYFLRGKGRIGAG